MESLDHSPSGFPCHLSPAKSSTSIDQYAQLHNKRDSAYSSFSTNSSTPEYPLPVFTKERSFSMDNMHSECTPHERMKQADIRYIKTVYDRQRGVSEEYEVHSSSLLKNHEGKSQADRRSWGRSQGKTRNFGVPSWTPHIQSVPDCDNIQKGAPSPPARRESYTAIKHREMTSSWLKENQSKSCQIHSKGVCQQPMTLRTPGLGQQLKSSFMEGQLHTVIEKSPESCSMAKFKSAPQPGQPMLPTGVYPVPIPEPHFAQAPQNSASSNGMIYPALAKESGCVLPAEVSFQIITTPDTSKNSDNMNHTTKNHFTVSSNVDPVQQPQDSVTIFAQYKPHLTPKADVSPSASGQSKCESSPPKYQLHGMAEMISQSEYSNCITQALKAHQRSASESKAHSKPSEHWRSEVQEERETNIWRRERDSLDHITWDCRKSKETFASLQGNPDASRMQSTKKVNELLQWEGHADAKQSTENMRADDERGPANKQLKNLDQEGCLRHSDGITSTVPVQNAQPKYENPSSPFEIKAFEFGRSRLSSSSSQISQGFQFGKLDGSKPRCSVLEKISKIEQREQESQRTLSTSGTRYNHNGLHRSSQSSSARSSLNSIEDLRNKFTFYDQPHSKERTRSVSTVTSEMIPQGQTLHRTRVRSEDTPRCLLEENRLGKQFDKSNDYSLHLQKEMQLSTIVLKESERTPTVIHCEGKEELLKHNTQVTHESQLDNVFHRTYRNSIKDAQSKVLRATSFRRKDLDISPPIMGNSKKSPQRQVSAHEEGKTQTTSPHAPKERHSITPTEISVTSHEHVRKEHHVARIGGRKRMTVEQKKRSYSEPEKMNEVGVSDNAPSPLCCEKKETQFIFPENTVADRRRLFERGNKACSTNNLSKPELKQLQQNALADYIERKTGQRPSSQETKLVKERSHSTYFQTNTRDNQSITSASSMNSLQDQCLLYRNRDPEKQPSVPGRVSSTLPPGLIGFFDLNSFEQKTEKGEGRCRSSSFVDLQMSAKHPGNRYKLEPNQEYLIDQKNQTGHSQFTKIEHPVERPSPSRNSGKSVSAEDLLDRSEQQPCLLHVRSSSSPSADKKTQDLMRQRTFQESGNFLKDCFHGSQTSSFKHEERRQTGKKQSPTHYYSQWDVSGSEKKLQATHEVALRTHSRMDSESQISKRSGAGCPFTDQSSQLREKSSVNSCAENSTAKPVESDENFSNNPSFCLQLKGGCLTHEQPGKTFVVPSDKGLLSNLVGWRSHNDLSLDASKEDKIKKTSPPQRPPPPKLKLAHSVKEEIVSKSELPSVSRLPSLGIQRSSSSEQETSLAPSPLYGKISLRISESCLQTPPLLQQDDEDDDVFVTETQSNPSLPPPPPLDVLSLEEGVLRTSIEDFPPPPPHVFDQDSQDEDKTTGLEKEPSECSISTELPFTEQKPVFSTPDKEMRFTNALNSETPLSRVVPDVHVTQEEHQNIDELPEARYDSSLGETVHLHELEKSPLCLQSESSIHVKRKSMGQEDIQSLELAKEIASKDRSLADILDPDSKMKTTMDLMEGLFPEDSTFLKESHAKRKVMQASLNRSNGQESKKEKTEAGRNGGICKAAHGFAALTVELLDTTKGFQANVKHEEDQRSLHWKKNELIDSLNHKLDLLKDAKESLLADIKMNNVLGEDIEALIKGLCKTNEFDKYKMFIGDLDKVVNLLLSLSGRLARVENVLSGLGEDATAEEKVSLNKKRTVLMGQHEDARELKENLDRREQVVLDILSKYLSEQKLQDYQHFVKMKSALLIEQRELDDKIKLGQEQLNCLMENLQLQASLREPTLSTGSKPAPVGVIKLLPSLTSSF